MGARTARTAVWLGALLLALAFAAPAVAGTILVNDASSLSTTNCTIRQAIWLANITANGGAWPHGQTPVGATTIHPLTSNYFDFQVNGIGSCVIIPDVNPGTVIDLAAIAGQTIAFNFPNGMDSNWYGPTALRRCRRLPATSPSMGTASRWSVCPVVLLDSRCACFLSGRIRRVVRHLATTRPAREN